MNLLIFDLDGTLIDSKIDLVHSVNATRGLMKLPPISDELVSSYVGNGAPVLMRRALGTGGERGRRSARARIFSRLLSRAHARQYAAVRGREGSARPPA